MPTKVAASMALLAFSICLIEGIVAQNTFATTVVRSLKALVAMLFVGLVLGWMAQKMLEENADRARKAEIETKAKQTDR